MSGNEVLRWAVTGALLYSAYVTWTCPCDPLLGCHYATFMTLTLGSAAAVAAWNCLEP